MSGYDRYTIIEIKKFGVFDRRNDKIVFTGNSDIEADNWIEQYGRLCSNCIHSHEDPVNGKYCRKCKENDHGPAGKKSFFKFKN